MRICLRLFGIHGRMGLVEKEIYFDESNVMISHLTGCTQVNHLA